MIVRVIYDPKSSWEVHRFSQPQAKELLEALKTIRLPREPVTGDLIVEGNYNFYLINQDGLPKPIQPLPLLQQNPPLCSYCSLHKTAIRTRVPADVRKQNPNLMIIGMAPGREEDIENRPFVESAPAGGLMRRIVYNDLKLPKDEVAWTNIVKCFPTTDGNMRDPNIEELMTCSGAWLWYEILEINPKVIVAAGGTAVNFLLKYFERPQKITDLRGNVYTLQIGDREFPLMPIIHPSAVARAGGREDWLEFIKRDVRAAYALATTTRDVLPKWYMLNSTEQAVAAIDKVIELYEAGEIEDVAIDIETDSLLRNDEDEEFIDFSLFDPDYHIVGYGLAWSDDYGVFIPATHPESQVDLFVLKAKTAELLSKVPVNPHGGKFDQSWFLAKWGLKSKLNFDTMLASYARYGRTRRHGLKGWLMEAFKWPPYEQVLATFMQKFPLKQRRYSNAPLHMVAEYCVYDTVGTHKLKAFLKEKIEKEAGKEVHTKLIKDSDFFRDVEVRGAAVDLKKYRQHLVEYPMLIQEEVDKLKELYEVKDFIYRYGDFNHRSPDKLRLLLYGRSRCKNGPECGFDTAGKESIFRATGRTIFDRCPKCGGATEVEKYVNLPPPAQFKCPICSQKVGCRYDDQGRLLHEVHNAESTKFGLRECTGALLEVRQVLDTVATSKGHPATSEAALHPLIVKYSHRHAESGKDETFCKICNRQVPVDLSLHPSPEYHEKFFFLVTLRTGRKKANVLSKLNSLTRHIRPTSVNEEKGLGTLIYNHRIHWTKTGRISTRDYSIHTAPWHSDVRRLIVSEWIREGGLILSADYSQLELRILTCLSQDPGLIEAYRAGKDLHRVVASRVWKRPETEITDTLRRFSKTMSFGIVYGRGGPSIAEETGLPVPEAERIINVFLYEEFKKVGEWIDATHRQVERDGRVTGPTHRVFELPEIFSSNRGKKEEAKRQAQNYQIQSAASDLNTDAAVATQHEYEAQSMMSYVWGVIHDAIENSIYPGELLRALPILDRKMSKDVPNSFPWIIIPIVSEYELAARWDGSVKVKEWGPDWIRVEGFNRYFEEIVEVARVGYENLKIEIVSDKPRNKLEEIVLRRAYEGDDGGDRVISAYLRF